MEVEYGFQNGTLKETYYSDMMGRDAEVPHGNFLYLISVLEPYLGKRLILVMLSSLTPVRSRGGPQTQSTLAVQSLRSSNRPFMAKWF